MTRPEIIPHIKEWFTRLRKQPVHTAMKFILLDGPFYTIILEIISILMILFVVNGVYKLEHPRDWVYSLEDSWSFDKIRKLASKFEDTHDYLEITLENWFL
jgi:hypothetical protein